jgi:hypothetical protein
MGLPRALGARVASVTVLFALLAACGGASQNPPEGSASGSACLVFPLTDYCCADGGETACVASFDSAKTCAAWPEGAGAGAVTVYATPCSGLVAVARKVETYTSVSMYDATTLALYAIGDDAATEQTGSLSIECGAGPKGFEVPGACALVWLDPAQGVACGSGAATATSVCQ